MLSDVFEDSKLLQLFFKACLRGMDFFFRKLKLEFLSYESFELIMAAHSLICGEQSKATESLVRC